MLLYVYNLECTDEDTNHIMTGRSVLEIGPAVFDLNGNELQGVYEWIRVDGNPPEKIGVHRQKRFKLWDRGKEPVFVQIAGGAFYTANDAHNLFRRERPKVFRSLLVRFGVASDPQDFRSRIERMSSNIPDEYIRRLQMLCYRSGFTRETSDPVTLLSFWYGGATVCDPSKLVPRAGVKALHARMATPSPAQLTPATQQVVDIDVNKIKREVIDHISPMFTAIEKAMKELLVEEIKKSLPVVKVELKQGKKTKTKEGLFHKQFDDVLKAIQCGNLMLVGPAGSGKTTIVEQVAELLGLDFYACGMLSQEYKLLGFENAKGSVTRPPFRNAFENGGVMLFDEFDAFYPSPALCVNSALANGYCDFPDGMIKQHKDFIAVACCNTFGRGADRQYVGRNQLDAATLDRFIVLEIEYDEALEMHIAGNAEWTTWVQSVRHRIESLNVRHLVSPRASIYGAKLLEAGTPLEQVKEMTVWKGLDRATREKINVYL